MSQVLTYICVPLFSSICYLPIQWSFLLPGLDTLSPFDALTYEFNVATSAWSLLETHPSSSPGPVHAFNHGGVPFKILTSAGLSEVWDIPSGASSFATLPSSVSSGPVYVGFSTYEVEQAAPATLTGRCFC